MSSGQPVVSARPDADVESDSDSDMASEAPAEYTDEGEALGEQRLPWLPGRLRANLAFWQSFCSSTFVLSVLTSGYVIEWEDSPPPPCEFKNKAGCFGDNYSFTCEAMTKLLAQGALRKCGREQLHCILAMDVHVNVEGKQRLIVDARPVNRYEKKRKFKCETLGKEGRDIFDGCVFGGSIDISHAYHHIEMAAVSQRYLGVEWEGDYFAWQVLPFGLSSAPWVWVLVSREPVAHFREMLIKVLHYMDDLPHGAAESPEARRNAQYMIEFLRKCGFVIDPQRKCVGYDVPLEAFVALGFTIDLQRQLFLLKPGRAERITGLAQELLERKEEALPAKLVAGFAGIVVSASLALGGVTRMRTRALYAVLGDRRSRADWRATVRLSQEAIAELEFWAGDWSRFNGMPIRENRRSLQVDVRGASDAGATGYGGWFKLDEACREDLANEISCRARTLCWSNDQLWQSLIGRLRTAVDFRGELSLEQQSRSSTWREAWAVCEFLEFAAPMLEGCRVRLNLDNSCLVFGLGGVVPGFEEKAYGGSKRADIQRLLVRIFDTCVWARISLLPVWVPREKNVKADQLSKMTDHYDFAVATSIFQRIDSWPNWGPHTVDRFSSDRTVLVRTGRYNARFWHTAGAGCLGLDAFAHDWQGEVNWVHAPYRLIGKVVHHMLACKARGTMVVPWWEKAAWWPLIRQKHGWAWFVREAWCMGKSVKFEFDTRRLGALVTHNNTPEELAELPVGTLWALRIDCSQRVTGR